MATRPPTREDRDKNLDALQKGLDEWADKEIKRLDNESKFLRSVLEGRGATKAGTKNLAKSAYTTVVTINDFLGAIVKKPPQPGQSSPTTIQV